MATPLLKYSFDTWTSGTSIANEGSLGSAYNGTLNTVGSGTATIISSDKANGTQCLSLSTNNGGTATTTKGGYMSIPAFTFGGTSYTVCCWYKKNSTTVNESWVRIFDFGNGAGIQNLRCGFYNQTGILFFNNTNSDVSLGSGSYCDNLWHHICLVFDSVVNKCTFYLNGVQCLSSVADTSGLSYSF